MYTKLKNGFRLSLLLILLMKPGYSQAQTTTIPSGSFIVNMGVMPQTVANALKPYGMLYDLISNCKVPVKWVIAAGKVKDGVDFTYNGVAYKGGPFIITTEYRSAAVNAKITTWQGLGVVGVTTTAPIEVNVASIISSVPRWTMDKLNGKVAVPYFTNAGIPATAYSLTRLPSELAGCDDIFVMPHAYPQWSTHSNLYFWNQTWKGSIWLSCTAGSQLEDMFNPADHSQQSNFLSEKNTATPFPTGTVTTIENALWLYDSHNDGTPPYTYTDNSNPFMQFLGTIDAATQNGLEQVYIPMAPGWRSTTTIGAYDPDHSARYDDATNHRAAIIAYGRGFGDANRGYVMVEAAHSLSSATQPANIAGQRVFFNFSFLAGKNASVPLDITGIPEVVSSGTATPVSFAFPAGVNASDFPTVAWSASCGGSFAANPSAPTDKTKAIFTPPAVTGTTYCPITVTLTDACGRIYNTSKPSTISSEMQITTTLAKSCFGASNGSITMAITGAAGAYNWSWTKAGGGTGSGSGATSPVTISGLAGGTYTVSVISGGGTGSTKSFTVTVAENAEIGALVLTPTNVLCNGLSTGAITVTNPTGGTPPYTFLWNNAATTQNLSGLAAGTYSVTLTDGSGCTKTGSATITQPTAITVTPTITAVSCYGLTTGAISLTVSGGTPGSSPLYTFAWNDGNTSQNRTGLAAGTYSVIVTDANNCTKTQSGIVVGQPSAVLGLSATTVNVACYGGSTGSIDLTVTGGTPTYTYNWGSVTTEDRTALAAGDYTVTVTDNKGCQAVLSKTITQPAALTLSTVLTHESCPAIADGAIVLTVTGGTGSYTYSWTGPGTLLPTPRTTKDLSGLQDGAYTVVVTDGNSCTATVTVTINTTNSNAVAPASIKH